MDFHNSAYFQKATLFCILRFSNESLIPRGGATRRARASTSARAQKRGRWKSERVDARASTSARNAQAGGAGPMEIRRGASHGGGAGHCAVRQPRVRAAFGRHVRQLQYASLRIAPLDVRHLPPRPLLRRLRHPDQPHMCARPGAAATAGDAGGAGAAC